MIIRLANTSDADSLIEFNQAMALETEGRRLDARTLGDGVRAVFADERKGFYLVAEAENRIVGGLMITFEWSDWRSRWFWWIQSVYVLPEARGTGVYRRLYERVVEMARQQTDVCGIRLYVERENARAQQVYEKLGMEKSPYRMYEAEIE